MSLILGIETTCDETAAAVVRDGRFVHSSVIATQFELHRKFRGVVPEIASRAHIENILPVITEAVGHAGRALADVDAIAVANRPGLIGSLLIGVTAAKTLAWALDKPLISVDHVQAHLYSVNLVDATDPARRLMSQGANTAQPTEISEVESDTKIAASTALAFPAVGLVVSGGHTALYRIDDFSRIERIGATIDDAVGEAYDKVAAILGLGFPGGPIVDALAAEGDASAIAFPRSYLARGSLDFSFSGLKTAVLYRVRGDKGRERDASSLSPQQVRDVAASFQAACVDVIIRKLQRAIDFTGARQVIVGGGVSSNRGLRAALSRLTIPARVPPMQFCTDNAAMIAGLAHLKYASGDFASLDLDAVTQSEIALAASV